MDINVAELRDALTEVPQAAETVLLAEGCLGGDTARCAELGDELLSGCFSGDGAACDLLWTASPGGSIPQQYGATCGGRFESVPDSYCSAIMEP